MARGSKTHLQQVARTRIKDIHRQQDELTNELESLYNLVGTRFTKTRVAKINKVDRTLPVKDIVLDLLKESTEPKTVREILIDLRIEKGYQITDGSVSGALSMLKAEGLVLHSVTSGQRAGLWSAN